MRLLDIINSSYQPELYKKGTGSMWTDEHISKQLLDIHLNPDLDLASRKMTTIEKTTDWILQQVESNRKLTILDLGCGPGLYSKIMAEQGHCVTGIDISETSINYAKEQSSINDLNITYQQGNYLEVDFESGKYDLVILVYTDFGVLTPSERETLLESISKALKIGGKLILDVFSDENIEQKATPKSWVAAESGFWKNHPYLALSESFIYDQEKIVLYQHLIIDNHSTEVYRFWTHYFSETKLRELFGKFDFEKIEFNREVIPGEDVWSGRNVIFSILTR